MLTRKDCRIITDVIADLERLYANTRDSYATLQLLVNRLGCAFAYDNPRFDQDKFRTACGFPIHANDPKLP